MKKSWLKNKRKNIFSEHIEKTQSSFAVASSDKSASRMSYYTLVVERLIITCVTLVRKYTTNWSMRYIEIVEGASLNLGVRTFILKFQTQLNR